MGGDERAKVANPDKLCANKRKSLHKGNYGVELHIILKACQEITF